MFHIAERMFNVAKYTFSIDKHTFSDAKHKIFQGRNIILKVKAYIPFGSRLERIKASNDASHQRLVPRPLVYPTAGTKRVAAEKATFFSEIISVHIGKNPLPLYTEFSLIK